MIANKCGWCNSELNNLAHPLQKFCNNKCRKKYNRQYIKEYMKKNYHKYKKNILVTSRKWRTRHPRYMKEWVKKHPKYRDKWVKDNSEHIRKYFRNYIRKLKEEKPDQFMKYRFRCCVYEGISLSIYEKLTGKCAIKDCGFSITVDLHHIDKNKDNNEISNLIGLCPSHHQVIHRLNYRLVKQENSWVLTK